MCNCVQTRVAAETQIRQVSVANPNLDGSGTVQAVIAGVAAAGTYINSITIKATGNTTQGMVRLFLSNGSSGYKLFKEIVIPAVTQTAVVPAFFVVLIGDFCLASGYILGASTQNAEEFNIIVEAMPWQNCDCK